ncbi:MAG TPA: hypothetical protein QF621_05795 [Candidatus Thalassarchaeaceae archaeon]|jgi:hypothetical protein|nr:hypothetical protein [Candidatus Poseidoniaceae archaeon]HJL59846.1 hypothetical protein [Candidatus Thalassarchaeaceae archaeon]
MAKSILERIDTPEQTDDEEIWGVMRTWLIILRIIIVVATIFVAELLEEFSLLGLSVSVWAVIIGIPAFILFSMLIIQGDKRLAPDLEVKRQNIISEGLALKKPIRKRE